MERVQVVSKKLNAVGGVEVIPHPHPHHTYMWARRNAATRRIILLPTGLSFSIG